MSTSTQPSLWQRTGDALGSKDFRNWIIACVAALFVGGHLSITAVSLWTLIDFDPSPVTRAGITLVFSLVFGIVNGCCHWFILRTHFRKAYWWIVATTLGYLAMGLFQETLMGPMLDVLSDPTVWGIANVFRGENALDIIRAILEGVTVGTAQWLFFKSRRVENAAVWVWVSIGVQLLRYTVPYPDMPDFIGSILRPNDSAPGLYTIFQIASTNVKGIVYGFPTGLLLLKFIAEQKQQRDKITG